MTTFATDGSAGLVHDEREREAWEQYAATLRSLGTAAYAEAEPPAWEYLQETLAEIAASAGIVDPDAPAL